MRLRRTVSQAVAASTGQTGWTQICSLAGLRWVQSSGDLANSQESGAPDQQFQTEQCPFCGVHAGSWVVLPEPPIAVAVASTTDEAAPVPVLAHAHPGPAWGRHPFTRTAGAFLSSSSAMAVAR